MLPPTPSGPSSASFSVSAFPLSLRLPSPLLSSKSKLPDVLQVFIFLWTDQFFEHFGAARTSIFDVFSVPRDERLPTTLSHTKEDASDVFAFHAMIFPEVLKLDFVHLDPVEPLATKTRLRRNDLTHGSAGDDPNVVLADVAIEDRRLVVELNFHHLLPLFRFRRSTSRKNIFHSSIGSSRRLRAARLAFKTTIKTIAKNVPRLPAQITINASILKNPRRRRDQETKPSSIGFSSIQSKRPEITFDKTTTKTIDFTITHSINS
jgi:hypothetical protein